MPLHPYLENEVKKMVKVRRFKGKLPDENGKMVTTYDEFEVEIMCSAKKYSMVRRPGCIPFVVSDREIVK